MRVALVFGGPSGERGISLNSARSVADHLGPGFDITSYLYVDRQLRFFSVERKLLYSNTPDDFDFRLAHSGSPLTEVELRAALRAADLVFPTIHGEFGEDGGIQALAAAAGVPCVGSAAAPAARAYAKFSCYEQLSAAGLPCIPSALVPAGGTVEATRPTVVKPDAGGSSLGITVVRDGAAVTVPVDSVVQPLIEGIEFTVVVVEGEDGPVALVPLEVERKRAHGQGILSYRDKYLPSDDTAFHCPPRFATATIEAIRGLAEQAFGVLELNDFARMDGWLLADGSLALSDVNIVSGMEQNSYLFIQAAQVGMTHREALRSVVRSTCRRAGLPMPPPVVPAEGSRKRVAVLFGGTTAERQVSVLSGTNVWLKLLYSQDYLPYPLLMTGRDEVWSVPYGLCLRHTVENVRDACAEAPAMEALRAELAADVVKRLALAPEDCTLPGTMPRRSTLAEALDGADFAFIALHGGWGENGELQEQLEGLGVAYNGSGPDASRLCSDKFTTGEAVVALGRPGLLSAAKRRVPLPSGDPGELEELWHELENLHHGRRLIVKPVADGCSAGIVPVASISELATYVRAAHARMPEIADGWFSVIPEQIVAMPTEPMTALLFEEFVVTDEVSAANAELNWRPIAPGDSWIEVTVGVVGERGSMRALNPSLTVAREGILSLEEKFMGGTGVNITPPPGPPLGRVTDEAVAACRAHIAAVANGLGIAGYARIDAFIDTTTGDTVVIEVNTLPGLTPSTVIYHQALAEEPALYPSDFLGELVRLGLERRASAS